MVKTTGKKKAAKKTKKATPKSSPLGPLSVKRVHAACLWRPYCILLYAHDSSQSFLKTFERIREGKKQGATTDEEQDLLRAMVVFAGAGIDSLLKQIVKSALPNLVDSNPKVQDQLATFAWRTLRGAKADPTQGDDGRDEEWSETDHKFLAKMLIADSPRYAVVGAFVDKLIGESLQSSSKIFEVVNCLGLDANELGIREDKTELDRIFDARNKIIHEMDIDFSRPTRNRFTRRRDDMVADARLLLDLGAKVLKATDALLAERK